MNEVHAVYRKEKKCHLDALVPRDQFETGYCRSSLLLSEDGTAMPHVCQGPEVSVTIFCTPSAFLRAFAGVLANVYRLVVLVR